MFEETYSTSLDPEDLLLAVVALFIPFGGWLFDRLVPGTQVLLAAVGASALVALRLIAGGQLLGSAQRALIGGAMWLGSWTWLAFGRGFVGERWRLAFDLGWLLCWVAALTVLVLQGKHWRSDDRGLAGAGLLVLAVVWGSTVPHGFLN